MSKDYVSKETCDARFTDITGNISDIKEDIKLIKVNHLAHIESDIGGIKLQIVEMKVSNGIKNKFIWSVIGAAVSIMVAFILKSFGVF